MTEFGLGTDRRTLSLVRVGDVDWQVKGGARLVVVGHQDIEAGLGHGFNDVDHGIILIHQKQLCVFILDVGWQI